jgi:hypothetical protein
MNACNLTELQKANDDNKPNHADKSGGIAVDVLPTGGVLLGTLKIQLLEQMPLRGDPAHSHFIPMLSRPPLRPRNLPQQPHTMRTGIRIGKYDSAEVIAAKNAERQRLQAIEKETRGAELKRLKAEDKARQREMIVGWHQKWGLDAVPLRVIGFEKEEAR